MCNKFYLILILIVKSCLIFGQTKESISKKIENIKNEINFLNELLLEKENKKKVYENSLVILQKKIEVQEKLIMSLDFEVQYYEKLILQNKELLNNLNIQYNQLINILTKSVNRYFLIKDKHIFILYILTSENIYQSQRRYLFYKRLIDEIKRKAKNVTELKKEINDKLKELELMEEGKRNKLNELENEKRKWERDKYEKDNIYKRIKRDEKELKKKIEERKGIAEKLEREMKKIVEEEIKRSKGKKKIVLSAEEIVIAGNFEKNIGRLPWPIEKGILIDRFGEHPHQILKNVKVRNNGIDIEGENNSQVKAIYEGVISKIVSILGAKYTVIIRHGNYLSVYQNLDEVYVKQGEKVSIGQKIGNIKGLKDEEGAILHFEVWKDFERLDPEIVLKEVEEK